MEPPYSGLIYDPLPFFRTKGGQKTWAEFFGLAGSCRMVTLYTDKKPTELMEKIRDKFGIKSIAHRGGGAMRFDMPSKERADALLEHLVENSRQYF